MKHEIESGYHPDADQISAFVEHALPAHEQQKMLAHLAVCPECRATAAMSLPLENELATPAEQTLRSHWFAGWRLALPGAAFAVITFLIFHIVRIGSSSRHTLNRPVQIAASQPPAPPSGAQPSANNEQALDQKAKPIKKSSSISAEKAVRPRESIATDALKSNQQIESTAQSNKLAALQSATVTAKAKPIPANPPTGEIARPAAQQPGVIAPVREFSEAKGRPQAGALHGAIGATAFEEAENPALLPLPSGLPILSEAVHLRQILAIDTRNNLFLSDDGGTTWRTVPVRWKGRAVQANLVSYGAPSQAEVISGLAFRAPSSQPSAPEPSINERQAIGALQAVDVSLSGTISDPTGAVISGAIVTAKATGSAGQVTRAATSDAHGHFMLDNLAPGVYDMKTQAPGFQQQLTQGVKVSAAQQNVANVTLSVGAAAQTVEVQAANGLETSSAPQASPIFEIVTDNGEHWTSPDGMKWKRK